MPRKLTKSEYKNTIISKMYKRLAASTRNTKQKQLFNKFQQKYEKKLKKKRVKK